MIIDNARPTSADSRAYSVSIGVGSGPRIGIQKGPLWATCPAGKRSRRRSWRGLRRRGERGLVRDRRRGFLKRQLSLPASTISQWWESGGQLLFHLVSRLYERTSIVVTTNPPAKTPPHNALAW